MKKKKTESVEEGVGQAVCRGKGSVHMHAVVHAC